MTKKSRNLVYKIIIIAIALFFAFSPISGGSDIGSRLMVNSLAIDGGETITASVEAVGKENEEIIGTGANLKLAFHDINAKEGKYAELAHCGLIVLGKDLSTKQAKEELMMLLSEGKINAGVSVIVADSSAEEFMKKAIKFNAGNSGGGVSEYITYLDQYLHIGIEKLISFLNKINSKSGSAAVAVMGVKDKEGEVGGGGGSNSSEGGGSQPSSGSDQQSEMAPTYTAKTFGTKEIIMDEAATRGNDWLINRTGSGTTSIKNFIFKDVDYGVVSADIQSKKGSVNIVGENRAQFELDIKLHSDNRNKLLDVFINAPSKSRPIFDALEEQFSAQIKSDAQALVDFCKTEHIDLLGLCNNVHKYRPKELKSVEETLDNFEVEIVTNISVN